MARVGEEFPLACPGCGRDIRLITFITDPGPIHATADWGAFVQVHDDRDAIQASPDDLPSSTKRIVKS